MTILERPVRQAQRRLWLNRWLSALGYALASAAGIFIVAVLLDRLWLSIPGLWLGYGALGLAAVAIVASMLWSYLTRERFEVAAARLDQAAGLRERLSSGLYCERSDDPFARAVVADAERTAKRLTVNQHLPLSYPRSAGWAGGSLVAALLFFWLFPVVDLAGKQEVREQELLRKAQVKQAEAIIRTAIAEQTQKFGEKNPTLKKELEQLEGLQNAKLEKPADVRAEALKRVEKLADKLEERRNGNDFAKIEEFQKMMRRLAEQQKNDQSPVNELNKALAKGDFKAAQEALQKIQQQLGKEGKTPEQQKQAAQIQADLKKLSDKINQIAQDDKKTKDELAKQGLTQQEIQQALQALKQNDMQALSKMLEKKGLTQQQVQQMMQQMQKRGGAQQAAQKLAQAMQKGAQQGQQGQKGQQGQQGQQSQQGQQGDQQGNEGLSEAGQQLSEMEQLEQQLNDLKSSMAELNQLKDQLGEGCKQCQGTGMQNGKACQGCQGTGGMGNPQQPGNGMGKMGIGQGGLRQQQETNTKTVEKKAEVKTRAGAINSQQFIDGEQIKGEVTSEYREAMMAAERRVSDAIAKEAIPRPIQGPVSEYFKHSVEEAKPKK